jgi:hypothetical protein
MNKIIFSVILSIFLIALTASDIFACSCFQPEGIPIEKQVKDAYTKSTSVFVGEVVEIIKKPEVYSATVRFKVEKTWNKNFQKEITLLTASESSLCGYTFEVGKKYLVYASENNNNLTTNICTRTASITSNKDIVFLNKIRKPKIKSSPK